MDTEEVVSPEDARTVASWAICSVRAQRLRHLNVSRFLVCVTYIYILNYSNHLCNFFIRM